MKAVNIVSVFVVVSVAMDHCVAFDPDQLTQGEKLAVGQLREILKEELTAEYMGEDYYLAHWLGKRGFSVEKTVELLRKYLEFRAEQKMDTILEEDWEEMRERFPYSRKTIDKHGRPLLYINMGDWDICGFLAGGYSSASERLARYMLMFQEESDAHVRQLRAEGRQITQFKYITNAAGFSPQKHACAEHKKFLQDVARRRAQFASPDMEQVIIVNFPDSFKNMYSPLSERAGSVISLYGQDRSNWEPKLLEHIDPDQLPEGLLNAEGAFNVKQEL